MQATRDQAMRLVRECAQLQRAFAFHPRVSVVPLQNGPPAEYQVSFLVRTLALDEQGECQWVDHVDMHIWLPPDFPQSAPLFRPMSPVFHPNISNEAMVGLPPWDQRLSLAQLVPLVGFALAYRSFNSEQIADETALAWAQENSGLLPTDPDADFSPDAGGYPLLRIAAKGPDALTQLRQILDQQVAALRGDSPPAYEQLLHLADSTRRQLAVFLALDIPAELREPAAGLDEAFARLPGALGRFELIGRQRRAIGALHGARAAAAETAGSVDVRCKVCDDAVALNLPLYVQASGAIRQVPPMALLQSWQDDLKSATEFAQHLAEQLAVHQKHLQEPLEVGRTFGEILDHQINAATAEITGEIGSASASAAEALGALGPAIARAQEMLAALQRCMDWRSYVELLERGVALERRMRGRDIASLQAFTVAAGGELFGPFEMEQPVTLGSATVTAQSLGQLSFEVVDAHRYHRLGASNTGKASVLIEEASGEAREYEFSISHRCDEVRAQVQAVARRTTEALTRLKQPLSAGDSRIGALAGALSAPAGFAQFEARQREAEERWNALINDLGEIELLKERLSTYFLAHRYSTVLPQQIAALHRARKLVHEAVDGLNYIQKRMVSQKGRLMLPEEFVADHARLTRQRELAEPQALGLQKGIDIAAKLIRHRLGEAQLWGAALYPAPRVLAPPGPELTQLILAASDEKLVEMIVALEEIMRVRLCPPSWRQAPPPEHAAPPGESSDFLENPQEDDGLIIE